MNARERVPAARATRDLRTPLHVGLAIAAVVLLGTSPWISLRRAIPDDASLLDWMHVVLGALVLPLALAYLHGCTRAGAWRDLYPWLCGRFAPLGADLAGLLRGMVPGAEGGGLFAVLKGLLLLALLATAVTGAGWLLVQGSAEAFAWRHGHLHAVHAFIGLLAAHVVAVGLHVLALARG